MISIIIPVYNDKKELRRALTHIAKQTFRDFEVIVVDDGSVQPLGVVNGQPSTVNCLRQEHRGAAAARNRGAREAHGEFLLFCDADVRMRPNMLGRMREALLAHPEASFVYSSFYFGWKKFEAPRFDPEHLRRENYIHTTSLIRREHFSGFDESLARFQDWDLWLTMLESGCRGIAIPETLFHIARTRGTMSRWIPSFGYRRPWRIFWRRAIEKYEQSREVIRKKHHYV